MTTAALFGYGFTGQGALVGLTQLGWDVRLVATHTPEREEVPPPHLQRWRVAPDATLVVAPRRAHRLAIGHLLPEVDVLLCAGYRRILPPELLAKGRRCFNIHSGKLPKYAGRRPVQRAIEADDLPVVCTLHEMIEEVDAGEVLETWPTNGDTLQEIYPNLAKAAAFLTQMLPRHV